MPRYLACLLPLLLAATTNADAQCLPGQPSVVRLTGVLERVTFAGPPNYESIQDGDEAETYFVLRLPAQVCVRDADQGVVSADRLQLLLEPGQYALFRPRLGTRITLPGELWPAESGHHHTPLMFTPVPDKAGANDAPTPAPPRGAG
ncbi:MULTISPECIES: DUF4431 domain-containing protein [unclassified Xanthomonas]|uniref:DUF4431 domain-containing protein n=1 Tax=unclassified Xanthomonas TaxID=2643310 RepID=UPI0021E09086|nr:MULTISPECIES: DUF4431 domain-containing protein [unclassified Xanthomonas]UYC20796.1 DUF4431 domain-containing protein [Xanthomonas sp. CFBP 8443]